MSAGGPLGGLGRLILSVGLLLTALGLVLILAGRMGLPFGRLPGDFAYRGRHVTFFAPLGTMLLLSLLLTAVLNLFSRFRR